VAQAAARGNIAGPDSHVRTYQPLTYYANARRADNAMVQIAPPNHLASSNHDLSSISIASPERGQNIEHLPANQYNRIFYNLT
jgi:hypothetical protein